MTVEHQRLWIRHAGHPSPHRTLAQGAAADAGPKGASVGVLPAFMAVVRSDSMRPTLESGDVLFVSRVHRRSRLRRGEIVVRRAPDASGTRLGRLIGLPGDRVQIDVDGVVTVNGEPVYEPYARRSGGFRGSFAVPGDRYFLLADRREGLHNARAWQESFVPVGDVKGVARVRLLPWPIATTGVLAR